ncbi:MAG: hypothetical protein ABL984_17705 [Pyrinomonadaceae bacterium]
MNETEVKAFWRWFEEHAKRGEVDQAAVRARVKKLCDRLDVFIRPNEIRACRDLILSANYARDAFPIVDELVLAAPPIEGWSIIAFLPQKQLTETFNFEGIVYSLKNLSFVPDSDGFDLAVVICADLQTITEDAIQSLFHDILGEYESICGVRYLDIVDSSALDEDVEVRHISELYAVVENFHHFEAG